MTKLHGVRCQIDQATFALERGAVHGVHRAESMRPSESGSALAGALATPFGDLPVYRLADLLGIKVQSNRRGHIVLVAAAGEVIGLLVERVSQFSHMDGEVVPLSPLLGDPRGLCFSSIYKLGAELLPRLAPERFGSSGAASPGNSAPARYPQGIGTANVVGDRLIIFAAGFNPDGGRPVKFGLGLHQIAEVLDMPAIVAIPGAPSYVRGVTVWRDAVIPVADLVDRLGLESTGVEREQLLVVRGPSGIGPVGVPVNDTRLVRLPLPNEQSKRPLNFDKSLIYAAVELRRETLLLPDLAAVLRV